MPMLQSQLISLKEHSSSLLLLAALKKKNQPALLTRETVVLVARINAKTTTSTAPHATPLLLHSSHPPKLLPPSVSPALVCDILAADQSRGFEAPLPAEPEPPTANQRHHGALRPYCMSSDLQEGECFIKVSTTCLLVGTHGDTKYTRLSGFTDDDDDGDDDGDGGIIDSGDNKQAGVRKEAFEDANE
ncbi:unnamed protein product [Arctogadus glacialis]